MKTCSELQQQYSAQKPWSFFISCFNAKHCLFTDWLNLSTKNVADLQRKLLGQTEQTETWAVDSSRLLKSISLTHWQPTTLTVYLTFILRLMAWISLVVFWWILWMIWFDFNLTIFSISHVYHSTHALIIACLNDLYTDNQLQPFACSCNVNDCWFFNVVYINTHIHVNYLYIT